MSLLEKLKAKQCLKRTVVVDGDTYEVVGLDLAAKSRVYAKARKGDGTLDSKLVDAGFLSQCVRDPESQKRLADVDVWSTIPGHVTGPLLEVIAEVCGLKTEGAIDPKDLDSIES